MSIFTRFRDIINSNINAMLDEAEDPEKLVRLMIQEMEDTLVELKASCAGAIATQKKLDRTYDDFNHRVLNWEQKAALAINKGREDLAREALLEKRRFATEIGEIGKQRTQIDDVLRGYRTDISQLEEKITAAREKQQVLVHRHVRAQHRQRAQQQIRQVEAQDTILRYEQFEAKIDRMEADADLVNFGHKPSIEDEFHRLESDETIEKELAELKQKIGKPDLQQPPTHHRGSK